MTDDLPRFTDAHNYVMSGKTLNLICDAIRRRTPLDGGCLVEATPNGFTMSSGIVPPDFPFRCPTAPSSASKISPGTVNGTTVTGTDSIDIGENDIVYIKADLTLVKSAGGYITGMSDVTYEVQSGTDRPDDTTTAAYFPIAQYFDGVCAQYVFRVLGHTVDDDGTKTNVPAYFWGEI